jgi:hypothetical protein
MKTLDTTAAVGAVLDYAKDPMAETRVVDEILPGQWVRQGDVYLVRTERREGWKETRNRQLAPGTTMGSRHTVDDSVTVLANPEGAKVERTAPGTFRCRGPQVVSADRFTVSHPEHADFSLPAGIYDVCFQVDPQTLQRVQD